MRRCVLGLILLTGACRDGSDALPRQPETGQRAEPAIPAPPSAPPEPPELLTDKGDCSSRHAPRPDRDRFPMCRIPAGEFDMGYQPGEPQARLSPPKRVRVEAFLIDQVEVTAAQYFHFLVSLGREGLTNEKLRDGWWGGKAIVQRGSSYHLDRTLAHHPINTVQWEAARSYCEWAGKRLPTSAEWEFASRYDPRRRRGLRFPWGDRFDAQANGCDLNPSADAFPHYEVDDVGMFDGQRRADGRSPTGVHDLFGNADEWVADAYSSTSHIRRGCAHDCVESSVADWSHDSRPYAGFRCAADLSP